MKAIVKSTGYIVEIIYLPNSTEDVEVLVDGHLYQYMPLSDLQIIKERSKNRTLLIYNPIEEPLKYAILEGDYSGINGVCINACDENEDKIKMACSLLFDDEGNYLIDLSEDVTLMESKNWDKVAIVTFLP